VAKDYAEAIRWFRFATNLGNVDAPNNMAELLK
jgi:TPR repeat protein